MKSVVFLAALLFAGEGPRVETAALPQGSDHEHKDFEREVGPIDVQVQSYTQSSITLHWKLSKEESADQVQDYRIYYMHGNFTDVKTIGSSLTHYQLSELRKSTFYWKAWEW